ncbi:MerR family transcriptional regulator [Pantoea sp.]|uniref:MerR family transcriptional regulator n=1 Tax=Pantoea sp. TaxID=69393 RepID=UPI00289E72C8|nr:MerR family transcriptional regulator [Pantoea sp.]
MFTSVSTVCRMVDVLPAALENWQTASLIIPPGAEGYSESQVAQIRVIRALTSSGDTLEEIRILLNESWRYRASGWETRREEFLFHLRFGTDETRAHHLWKLCTYCSPEDVRVFLLMPLASRLCEKGRETLKTRFIKCLLSHSARLIKHRQGKKYVKPLLELIKIMKPQPLLLICMHPQTRNLIKTGPDKTQLPWKENTAIKQ